MTRKPPPGCRALVFKAGIKWRCELAAACVVEHEGEIVPLCASHDAMNAAAEIDIANVP